MTTTAAPSTASPEGQFVRGIGPVQAISLVVGTMIGSGIFIVSSPISREVSAWGPGGLMLVWVLTGLMTMAGALAYAELAASVGGCGSAYGYSYAAFGEFMAWVIGWDLVLEYGVSVAAVTIRIGTLRPWYFTGTTMPMEPTVWPVMV